MRYIAFLLSFAMFMQFNLMIGPTYADAVTVTTMTTSTPGGITGQVAVTKVGALIAGDALAILSGTEIHIESKAKSKSTNNNSTTTPPSNDLLNGVLIQTKAIANVASGFAIFNGGDRFSRINSKVCPDKVTTNDGTTYTGTITQATANALTMSTSSGTQTINASNISDVHSARAFKFNIPNYNGPDAKMSFTTTCQHAAAAKVDNGNTMKKLIIIGLALTVVAVAIAVPVGIAASHHHHNNNYNNIVLANYLKSRNMVPTPAMPAGTMMPTPQQLGASYIANLQRLQSTSSSTSVSGTFTTVRGMTGNGGTTGSTVPPIIIP